MPAYKLEHLRHVFWVGTDADGRTLIHDARRHGHDFGMIRVFVKNTGQEILVDRLWPVTFTSCVMSEPERLEAVVSYLRNAVDKLNSDLHHFAGQVFPTGECVDQPIRCADFAS